MAELVALQWVSRPEVDYNLAKIRQLLASAPPAPDSLVVLPECFACFGGGEQQQLAIAEPLGAGSIQHALADIARKFNIWLVAGSMPIKTAHINKFSATCLVFNSQGQQVADYQKIHLFDVEVGDNTGSYQESRFTQAGEKLVVLDCPLGRVGLAICYDLRFAGLFQAMCQQYGQIDILTLPAAFTEKTGRAHWHALLNARAIENQCFVVAANQGGEHANGRRTFGHSCILSPWGETLTQCTTGEAILATKPDMTQLKRIRQAMPVADQNRFRSYLA